MTSVKASRIVILYKLDVKDIECFIGVKYIQIDKIDDRAINTDDHMLSVLDPDKKLLRVSSNFVGAISSGCSDRREWCM